MNHITEIVSSTSLDFTHCLLRPAEYFIVKNEKSEAVAISPSFSDIVGYSNPIDYLGKDDYEFKCNAVELAPTFISQDRKVLKTGNSSLHLTVTTFLGQNLEMYLSPKQQHDNYLICNFWRIQNSRFSAHMYNTIKSCHPCYLKEIHQSYPLIEHYKNLSTRESEILYFLLHRKSSSDMGELLHLSSRTVQHHIERIKMKMCCSSTQMLTELSIYLGYHECIPATLLNIKNTSVFTF